jgi:hypothetical protein
LQNVTSEHREEGLLQDRKSENRCDLSKRKKLPERVLIILDTLSKSFTIVKNETNLSERTKRSQDVRGAIKQIEEMYPDKNKEIIAKAKQILKEIELQTG